MHVHSYISSNGRACLLLYCTLRHCGPMKSVVTYPTKEILQNGSRPHVVPYCWTMTTVCISYSDVIYTHAQLTDCEASRKAYGLSELPGHAVAATLSKLKLNFSPVRGSILMRFRSIEPPEFILLAIEFSSKSVAKYEWKWPLLHVYPR